MALFFNPGGAVAGQSGGTKVGAAAAAVGSVTTGLGLLSSGSGEPELKAKERVEGAILDANRVLFESGVRAAFETRKEKSEAIIGAVASHFREGVELDAVKATFSSYLVGKSSLERIGKLSDAAHAYVSNPANPPQTRQVISIALKAVLADHPDIKRIAQRFESGSSAPMSEKESNRFFSQAAFVKLADGLVNPFLFPHDVPANRDMSPIVDAVNDTLGQGRLSARHRIDLVTQAQSRSLIDGSVHEQFVKFERSDLGIAGDLDSSSANAYTILGLHVGVDHEVLQGRLTELSNSGYRVGDAVDSRVRNAAFQVQTRDGRAAYDEYLESKTKPIKKEELQARIVTEAEGYRTGTHPRSFLMNALLYCIKTHR